MLVSLALAMCGVLSGESALADTTVPAAKPGAVKPASPVATAPAKAEESPPKPDDHPAEKLQDRAEENFHAGRALLKDKRYTDACPKFEESQREDPASGTLLALAYCQELSGLLASSWANYVAAAQLSAHEGQSERQRAANERAQALSERLSMLTIAVPPELLQMPSFRVLRDGVELERSSLNVPLPMNGGTHAFEASAPGRKTWLGTVTLQSERDRKTLNLPILESVDVRDSTSPHAPPLTDSEEAAHRESLQRRDHAAMGLAAGSLVALGIGTTFGFVAKSKNSDSNADGHCDNSGCDARGAELRHDAQSAARVSTWSFVAGGVLAACSLTLYLTGGTGTAPVAKRSVKLDATALPGESRFSLMGTF